MPRKSLIRTDHLPYHVTARANNREEFFVSRDEAWKIISHECLFLTLIYGVEFQSVVLMPNHFHIILTVPEHDLGIVMNQFIRSISRSMNLISGRSGHVFGASYHWSLINNSRYFGHALKYVYRNPVRARICEKVEEYPYSSLHGLLGKARLPFPIHLTRAGMELSLPEWESRLQLDWLNMPFPTEAEEVIQKGLRRKVFHQIMDRSTRRPYEFLEHLL